MSNLAVNAVVHASAKRVDLKLEDHGAFVVLKVTNQGISILRDVRKLRDWLVERSEFELPVPII
jgi:signal transduction histidine kinase